MPADIVTTLKKVDSMRGETNRVIIRDFFDYMGSKDPKSYCNTVNLLELMISFDKFHDGLPFTSTSSKGQILSFLNHRYFQSRIEKVN